MRRERPIFSSSSTTRIRRDGIIRSYVDNDWQEYTKTGPAQLAGNGKNVAARKQRAFACDRKAKAHPSLLERNSGLEKRLAGQIAEAGAGIVHFDGDAVVERLHAGEDLAAFTGGIRRVFQKVDEDAFHQVLI